MKFGVIGTGWITVSYVDGALDSGLWELSAVYSRSREKGLEFGKKYQVDTVFTDMAEMANSDLIEAVYIASPNMLHVEHCRIFLDAGKHVICEKPLASHAGQVQELQTLAKKRGVIFLEAIMFMHLPQRRLLEEAIEKIGTVSMATFDFCQRSSKYDAYLGGALPNIFNPLMETGALMDLGVYCLYPALCLFGMPQSHTVDLVPMETGVDGSGIINLRYPDQLVCLRFSKLTQAAANSDIQGNLGTVDIESISRLANMKINYTDGGQEELWGDEEKYKLMGYEAKDFYRFITEPENSRQEYERCSQLSIMVTDYLEILRLAGGIRFPSDK